MSLKRILPIIGSASATIVFNMMLLTSILVSFPGHATDNHYRPGYMPKKAIRTITIRVTHGVLRRNPLHQVTVRCPHTLGALTAQTNIEGIAVLRVNSWKRYKFRSQKMRCYIWKKGYRTQVKMINMPTDNSVTRESVHLQKRRTS